MFGDICSRQSRAWCHVCFHLPSSFLPQPSILFFPTQHFSALNPNLLRCDRLSIMCGCIATNLCSDD